MPLPLLGRESTTKILVLDTELKLGHMKKMKPLLPSMAQKKRYIAFEIVSQRPISASIAKDAFQSMTLGFLGVHGTAKAGLIFVSERYNPTTQRGILRVANTSVDAIKSMMCLNNAIAGTPAMIRSLAVSGILSKAAQSLS